MKYTLERGVVCLRLCFFLGITWAVVVLSVWSLLAYLLLGGTLSWILGCRSWGLWLVAKTALRSRPQMSRHNDASEKIALLSFEEEVALNRVDAILGSLSFASAYLLLWWGSWAFSTIPT